METLTSMVELQAAAHADDPAVVSAEGDATTYGDFARLIGQRANDLSKLGIRAGDRVAIVLENGPQAASVFLAVAAVATAAPLNPGLTQSEFEFYLGDLDARALIVAVGGASPSIDAASALGIPVFHVTRETGASFTFAQSVDSGDASIGGGNADDVALVLHTSGTTARPKIVPLTHRNLVASARNVAETLRLSSTDTCLNVMPLFHIHGLVAALLATLSVGATVVCTSGFRAPLFFEALRQHGATWYTAVPTMHQSILERARAGEWQPHQNALRLARSSSASLAPSVLAGLEGVLDVPVVEAYGMTEAAHQMASNPVEGIRKPGSVGPAAGPSVAVMDAAGVVQPPGEIGEIVIRGANVTRGYHGLDEQAAFFHPGGWFRTGDQGYLDRDHYLFLTGRLKEIINRGGETIAPREIDEAMLRIEGIRQAVAFAVDDSSLGEEVAAAVVLEPGFEASEDELQAELSDVLSFAKVPKRIVFVDEIPKGPTGKLQRIGLAERIGLASVHADPSSVDDAADVVRRVAATWRSVLELDSVGPDAAFLESGGDSLTATALAVAIEAEFDVDLPLLAFYNAATIRQQAALIDRLRRT